MKTYHDIIWSEDELKKFYSLIFPKLQDLEVGFVSLSARNKYLSKEERETLELGRTEMFERKIIRHNEWNRFLRTIKKFETVHGSYTTKNGSNIPDKCMVCYINLNPTNVLLAYNNFSNIMNEYLLELGMVAVKNGDYSNIVNRIKKLDHNLTTCLQKNRGSKTWIDIDFDVPKDFKVYEILKPFLHEKKLKYYWIDTKGGYHLVINKNTLKFNPNDICNIGYENLMYFLRDKRHTVSSNNIKTIDLTDKKVYEIIVNSNSMIPLPGTLQGGYKVKIL